MADSAPNRSLARNLVSLAGATIALIAAINIVFLIVASTLGAHDQPYVGILTWMILPAIMVFGIAVVLFGMILERRRRRRAAPGEMARFPLIDLNNATHRRNLMLSTVALVVFVSVSMIGSYQAYEFTDSDAFCGALCHTVMNPEYTAYKLSPHARVGCVNCHVGAGATWYVRSKLSGAYQVYAAAFNKYPRPIPSPVENLRPAQDTCEQCHWPQKFFGAQLKVFNHYAYDETNTPREIQLLIKTGGGSPTSGLSTGIHWHMNIANKITYIATDRQRQKIPYIRVEDQHGNVREYFAQDAKLTPQQIASSPKRRMDCVDCHNRPTHIYVPPDRSVDRAMLVGAIDRSLPFVKQQTVTALTAKTYQTTAQALQGISKDLTEYYQKTYPDVYTSKRAAVDRAIKTTQTIYQQTIFPEMKVDWRVHPDNIGHFYTLGCFRCHDDQHVSKDGKVISKDCNICHTVLEQKEGNTVMAEVPNSSFQHPVDLGDLRAMTCTDCHNGGPQ